MTHDEDVEQQSIMQKGFSTLKNGGTFWLFSILLVIGLGFYVHFFMTNDTNFLARQELKFGSYFQVKLNYIIMFALVWTALLFFAIFN